MKTEVESIVSRLRTLINEAKQSGSADADSRNIADFAAASFSVAQIPPAIAEYDVWRNHVGQLNPRHAGVHNRVIQFVKKVHRRLLSWYTRPLNHTFLALAAVVQRVFSSVEDLWRAGLEVDRRLDQLDGRLRAHTKNISEINLFLLARTAELEDSVAEMKRVSGTAMFSPIKAGRVEALHSANSQNGRPAEGLWVKNAVQGETTGQAWPGWSSTSERILDHAWALRKSNDVPIGSRILDLGCAESILAIELASAGYSVVGLDVRPYPLKHPSFEFMMGDLLTADIEVNSFDVVVALSTLERLAFGWHGDQNNLTKLELYVAKLYDILRPEGHLLITLPFGASTVTGNRRILGLHEIKRLFTGFETISAEYGLRLDEYTWISPVDAALAGNRAPQPVTLGAGAVAMLHLMKSAESNAR
jgi:SAM-dependent methyltransferase